MIGNIIVAWLASGFVGSLLWMWADWEWRNIGYAPMWWHILYPTLIGPVGLAMGVTLAVCKFQERHGRQNGRR